MGWAIKGIKNDLLFDTNNELSVVSEFPLFTVGFSRRKWPEGVRINMCKFWCFLARYRLHQAFSRGFCVTSLRSI